MVREGASFHPSRAGLLNWARPPATLPRRAQLLREGPWAEWLVRRSLRGAVRRELAGVYVRGPWPGGGAVLAPNHHSWWDGYLLRELAWQIGQDFAVMMGEAQLARFPFLQRVGAFPAGAARTAVRRAREGAWVVLFPEGAIQPPGALGAVRGGAGWAAGRAGVPLVPVALRLSLRGAERPEAFVRFGAPCPPLDLPARLSALLAQLDADLRAADPDQPPQGYLRVVTGRGSAHDAGANLPAQWLALLTGDRITGAGRDDPPP